MSKKGKKEAKKEVEILCWDNIIPNEVFFDHLSTEAKVLWEMHGGDKGQAKSFWMGKHNTARCALELFAQRIASFHSSRLAGTGHYLGAEYWVQQRIATCPTKEPSDTAAATTAATVTAIAENVPQTVVEEASSSSKDEKASKKKNKKNAKDDKTKEEKKVEPVKSTEKIVPEKPAPAPAPVLSEYEIARALRKEKKRILNEKKKENGLEFHFDKDEQAVDADDSWIHPEYSTATYLDARIKHFPPGGAPLIVFNTRSEEEEEEEEEEEKIPLEKWGSDYTGSDCDSDNSDVDDESDADSFAEMKKIIGRETKREKEEEDKLKKKNAGKRDINFDDEDSNDQNGSASGSESGSGSRSGSGSDSDSSGCLPENADEEEDEEEEDEEEEESDDEDTDVAPNLIDLKKIMKSQQKAIKYAMMLAAEEDEEEEEDQDELEELGIEIESEMEELMEELEEEFMEEEEEEEGDEEEGDDSQEGSQEEDNEDNEGSEQEEYDEQEQEEEEGEPEDDIIRTPLNSWIVFPDRNRHVVFPGNLLHGVAGELLQPSLLFLGNDDVGKNQKINETPDYYGEAEGPWMCDNEINSDEENVEGGDKSEDKKGKKRERADSEEDKIKNTAEKCGMKVEKEPRPKSTVYVRKTKNQKMRDDDAENEEDSENYKYSRLSLLVNIWMTHYPKAVQKLDIEPFRLQLQLQLDKDESEKDEVEKLRIKTENESIAMEKEKEIEKEKSDEKIVQKKKKNKKEIKEEKKLKKGDKNNKNGKDDEKIAGDIVVKEIEKEEEKKNLFNFFDFKREIEKGHKSGIFITNQLEYNNNHNRKKIESIPLPGGRWCQVQEEKKRQQFIDSLDKRTHLDRKGRPITEECVDDGVLFLRGNGTGRFELKQSDHYGDMISDLHRKVEVDMRPSYVPPKTKQEIELEKKETSGKINKDDLNEISKKLFEEVRVRKPMSELSKQYLSYFCAEEDPDNNLHRLSEHRDGDIGLLPMPALRREFLNCNNRNHRNYEKVYRRYCKDDVENDRMNIWNFDNAEVTSHNNLSKRSKVLKICYNYPYKEGKGKKWNY